MCGRFTLTATPEALAARFALSEPLELTPRYNIAPGQPVLVIHEDGSGQRVAASRVWGLVPHWADHPRVGSRMINARSETVAEKAAFRDAFARRRCLIPADGFYEWSKQGDLRQPYHVHRSDDALFAFAGIWESWGSAGEDRIDSCAILTTEANAVTRPIHDRMPVQLEPDDYESWLDPAQRDPAHLLALLRPWDAPSTQLHPVSERVNHPRFDDPRCLAPVDDVAHQGSLF